MPPKASKKGFSGKLSGASYAGPEKSGPAERVGPAGWKESDIQYKLSHQPQEYAGEDIGKITNAIINGTVKRGRVVNRRAAPRAKKPAAKKPAAKKRAGKMPTNARRQVVGARVGGGRPRKK